MAELLNGRALARELNTKLRSRIKRLERQPGLAVILIGSDPASQVYVARKTKVANRLGLAHWFYDLPHETSESDLLALVDELNANVAVDGILVQLPLPKHINKDRILDRIAPHKDADGFHPLNSGLLFQRRRGIVPCTPMGVIKLLEHAQIEIAGKSAVVIGRSNIVGRPTAMLLDEANATVTLCHIYTPDIQRHIEGADIVVSAVGKPGLIPGAWIKEGAVVVDIGITRLPDGTLTGDIQFEAAKARASYITPVPGGVGPMTIAMLMENTVRSAEYAQGVGEKS